MCIRDSVRPDHQIFDADSRARNHPRGDPQGVQDGADRKACLLYTSDAADERSSVDLGGRRIIKKKKTRKHSD